MPPKTPSKASTGSSQLTQRDLEILAAVWSCFEGTPAIDYGKLAQVANFKNAATARACFLPIRKKLLLNSSSNKAGASSSSASGPGPTESPSSGVGKKRAATTKAASPKKKKPKTAAMLDADDDVDDDDDGKAHSKIKKDPDDGDDKAEVEAQILEEDKGY
ncbi:hypothetical protein F4775DRAFT_604553 [Biscogniauxia sp. FL1348]|nr:hypothetical protein F4775DRAFT_604553 [Biscogniauxia sp. FL1348]